MDNLWKPCLVLLMAVKVNDADETELTKVVSTDKKYCIGTRSSLICHGRVTLGLELEEAVSESSPYEVLEVSNFGKVNSAVPHRARDVFVHDSPDVRLELTEDTRAVRIENADRACASFMTPVGAADLRFSMVKVRSAELPCGEDNSDNSFAMTDLYVYNSGLKTVKEKLSWSGTVIVKDSWIGACRLCVLPYESTGITLVAKEIIFKSSSLRDVKKLKADVVYMDNCTIEVSDAGANIEADTLRVTNTILRGPHIRDYLENLKATVNYFRFENNQFEDR